MKIRAYNKHYLLLIFWVGIISTVAYRLIVILNHYSPMWVEVSWYVGTIGFIWYFVHRYRMQKYHARLVSEGRLNEKIINNRLTGEDCETISYLLKSLNTSRAKWNSMAIFILSGIALVYATVVNIMNMAG